MALEAQFVAMFQLALAALLSVVIGLDRQRRRTEAGLRTHMLVGIGACLFTFLSTSVFPDDPARIAAQIVTGIGFLGAGAILKRDDAIQGLTTAASIWATAAVGMSVGLGAWFIAIVATLIIWFVLAIVRRLEPDK